MTTDWNAAHVSAAEQSQRDDRDDAMHRNDPDGLPGDDVWTPDELRSIAADFGRMFDEDKRIGRRCAACGAVKPVGAQHCEARA